MSESDDQRPNVPTLVKVGLLGVPTRFAAMMYFRICIIAAISTAVYAIWVPLLLTCVPFALAGAVAYYWCVQWADKNDYWNWK